MTKVIVTRDKEIKAVYLDAHMEEKETSVQYECSFKDMVKTYTDKHFKVMETVEDEDGNISEVVLMRY